MVAAGLLVLSALLPLALGRPSAELPESFLTPGDMGNFIPKGMRNQRFVVRDQKNSVPLGFKSGGSHNFIPPGMLRLTIAMPQSNATGLQAALLDVSNPNSENYGHHLSKSEVCWFTIALASILTFP